MKINHNTIWTSPQSTAALPVMGLIGSVWMLRRDRDHVLLWGPFALLNLASVCLLMWQTRAGAGAQLADEAFVQAAERGVLGLTEIQVGEHAPRGDGEPGDMAVLDLAEAPHEPGEKHAREPVGHEKV